MCVFDTASIQIACIKCSLRNMFRITIEMDVYRTTVT